MKRAIWLLLFLAGVAHATGRQTGGIDGRVVRLDGTGAASVDVRLHGGHGERRAHTDAEGRFSFDDLHPGDYTLDAEVAGEAAQDSVAVHIGQLAEVTLYLIPAGSETIVIAEDRPLFDKSRTAITDVQERKTFDRLPMPRTSFMGPVLLSPGVGVLSPLGAPIIRGGSWIDNQFLIDGVNYSAPLTNSILHRFDYHVLEEVEVLGGALDADFGQALGGVINIVTRSGTDEHIVAGRAAVSPSAFAASSSDGVAAGNAYNFNLNAGGPIRRGRAWYFTSATYNEAFYPQARSPGVATAAGARYRRVLGFEKLEWEPSSSHRLELHLSGYWERADNSIEDVVVAAEAQSLAREGGATGQLSWKATAGETTFETSVGGYYRERMVSPMSGDLDTPGVLDEDSGVLSVNGSTLLHDRELRLQLEHKVGRTARWHGAHELRAGLELALMAIRFENARPGNELVMVRGSACRPEELVFTGCDRAERTGAEGADGELMPGGHAARAGSYQIGLFARDSWAVVRDVRINAGWRIDVGHIGSQGDATLADFRGWWGPRLGVAWDVGGRGRTIARAYAGRSYQTGVLALPLFFGPTLRRDVYSFSDATGQFDTFAGTTGGDTGAVVDASRAHHPPQVTEAMVGLEQQLAPRLGLRVVGSYRLMSHLYSSDETNLVWNETGDSVVGFRDGSGRPRFSLITSPDTFRENSSLEVSLRGELGRGGVVSASYILSRLVGTSDLDAISDIDNVVPFVIASDRQRQFLFGPLSSDRRHVAKAYAAYTFAGPRLTAGTSLSISSGAPVSRLYFNPVLGGFYDFRAPRGVDPGKLSDPTDDRRRRTPVVAEWNLYGSWSLPRLFERADTSIEVQVTNALNSHAAVVVDERDTPEHGVPLVRQAPLRVTIGAAVRY